MMMFDSDSNDNSTDQLDLTGLTGDSVKRKRFSLIQREPNKETRRLYEEATFDNGFESYLDEETVKVEMESGGEQQSNITNGLIMKQEIQTKQGRGRPKKQNESHEWSDEATEALIYLWNQKEELYQKQHPYFYIREHKERAIDSIRMSLAEQGHIVTGDQVLSKFQSLRTYFCSQRNKLIAAAKKAGGARAEYEIESKWRFYKNLMFLDENMKPRENNKKYNRERDSNITDIDYTHGYPGNCTMDDSVSFHPMVTTANTLYSDNSMVLVGTHLPREPPTESLQTYRHSPERNPLETVVETTEVHRMSMAEQVHRSVSPANNNSMVCKNEDLLFGELVGNMIQQIPASHKKDLLKLGIQQMIIKAKYPTDPSK